MFPQVLYSGGEVLERNDNQGNEGKNDDDENENREWDNYGQD